jgi:hypothetical protein
MPSRASPASGGRQSERTTQVTAIGRLPPRRTRHRQTRHLPTRPPRQRTYQPWCSPGRLGRRSADAQFSLDRDDDSMPNCMTAGPSWVSKTIMTKPRGIGANEVVKDRLSRRSAPHSPAVRNLVHRSVTKPRIGMRMHRCTCDLVAGTAPHGRSRGRPRDGSRRQQYSRGGSRIGGRRCCDRLGHHGPTKPQTPR